MCAALCNYRQPALSRPCGSGRKQGAKRSRFDGRAGIEKIAAYNEAIAEERQLVITCTGQGEVYADPVLFGRAVSNLMDNAVRFTPDGGRIAISLTTDPGGADIAVKDTGCGVAVKHIPRMFDRFYRVDASRSSEQGMGAWVWHW